MAEFVERKTLLEALENADADVCEDWGGHVDWGFGWENIKSVINGIPAADVAPVVHGVWIEKSAPARKIYFECSHCGAQENKHTAIKGYYCWRCGAKMDGGNS